MFARTVDDKQLYYELHGKPGAKHTIIFLNGLTQSTLAWHLCLPYFKDDYRIVLMDLIFQGQSEKTGEWRDFDMHARDVSALMHHLGMIAVEPGEQDRQKQRASPLEGSRSDHRHEVAALVGGRA